MVRGQSADTLLLLCISTAISAIPTGLPTFVQTMLSSGAQRLAQSKAVVKSLSDVETLGGTTVINSDKTGTLTLNQMTATTMLAGGGSVSREGGGYPKTGATPALPRTHPPGGRQPAPVGEGAARARVRLPRPQRGGDGRGARRSDGFGDKSRARRAGRNRRPTAQRSARRRAHRAARWNRRAHDHRRSHDHRAFDCRRARARPWGPHGDGASEPSRRSRRAAAAGPARIRTRRAGRQAQ